MTKLTIGVAVALLGVSGLVWGCEDRAMLDAAAAFPANASRITGKAQVIEAWDD